MGVIVTSSFGAAAPVITTFTTWNPADKCPSTVLSNGDLTAAVDEGSVRTVASIPNGEKKIWEVTLETDVVTEVPNPGPIAVIGFGTASATICGVIVGLEESSGSYNSLGNWIHNGAANDEFLSYDINDTISIEYEFPNATFYKNGVLQGTKVFNLTGGTSVFPMVSQWDPRVGLVTFTANFGASPFVITPQPGFTGISA